ncbi:MAG: monovalent cation/H(+) antiporter subunit G [Acidimicrobiia bacterium]|nr:monovalent cation/H(+) antiporter subunit G [Acidimicrobiia bacterium]
MTPIAATLALTGALVALLAGIGLLRFRTPYARFHAAGKASPVAFLLVAAAAAIETGWGGAARLAVASAALVLTLPVGVHLLFRAVHRTTPRTLAIDELAPAEVRSRPGPAGP